MVESLQHGLYLLLKMRMEKLQRKYFLDEEITSNPSDIVKRVVSGYEGRES